MTSTLRRIKGQQQAWARADERRFDYQGYTTALDLNLFQPLSPRTREGLAAGDGAELGVRGERGKMQALHSSSALAVNVFDYWRGRDSKHLATALGLKSPIKDVRFEQKCPTGVPPRAPNLDVVIECDDGSILAIESKFCEPYGARKKKPLSSRYITSSPGRWGALKLSRCEKLAGPMTKSCRFQSVDAPQLLKHILGVGTTFRNQRWSLLYLWYDAGGAEARFHADEVKDFKDQVAEVGLNFSDMTYQDLFRRLERSAGPSHSPYVAFLKARYFA